MIKPIYAFGVFFLVASAGACGGSSGKQPSTDGATDHGSNGDGAADSNSTQTSPDASTDSGAIITAALCSGMCQVTLQIVCPNQPTMADCVSACLASASLCTAQGMALDQCLVANGPQALECDQVQQAVVLKDGFCVQESMDLVTCLQM
jgi:hypothetical protein